MEKASLSEKEQDTLINLICFLFENEKILRNIYDKVTTGDTVYYRSKKKDSKQIEINCGTSQGGKGRFAKANTLCP